MRFRDALLEFVVSMRGRRAERRLRRDARTPARVQRETLRRILERQADTEFGRLHRFRDIDGIEAFRERVPVCDYEALRPWIERQDRDGHPWINGDRPIGYAVTSGTTGEAKYVPVLPTTLAAQKRFQDVFVHKLLEERPRALSGHILAIVSPAVEGHMPSGRPFGSTSGQMYDSIPAPVRAKYVVPSAVFGIDDYDTKYLLILRLALQHEDISYLTTANPSTLVRLVTLARLYWDALVEDVERGGFHRLAELTPAQRRALRGHLRPRPARAAALRALRARTPVVRIRDLWPRLQAVGVWTGGSSSIFFDQLGGEFPEHTLIRDVGYLSSEFRGTVPIDSDTNAGVPSFQDNFFEFVRRDDWDRGQARFLELFELEDGEEYYVFVTTDSGLYRYDMNDIVQVDGCYQRVPRLRFVQKGKGVTNISGEKLYESQVIAAVSKVEAAYGVGSSFYLMLADEERARYELLFEPDPDSGRAARERALQIARDVDAALAGINVEYAAKRRSGRIGDLELALLAPGTFERFKRACLERGQREGQFKIVALQYRRDVDFDFRAEMGAVPVGRTAAGL